MTTIDDSIKYGMIEAISHLIHRDYEVRRRRAPSTELHRPCTQNTACVPRHGAPCNPGQRVCAAAPVLHSYRQAETRGGKLRWLLPLPLPLTLLTHPTARRSWKTL